MPVKLRYFPIARTVPSAMSTERKSARQQTHGTTAHPAHHLAQIFSLQSCRTPVWLKSAFAVLVQEGGVLVHGWCAEKENRGKGGSGKGKIGAGVGSCRSMDLVGISSGSRRDPVGHQF